MFPCGAENPQPEAPPILSDASGDPTTKSLRPPQSVFVDRESPLPENVTDSAFFVTLVPPAEALSAFAGENAYGEWRFEVCHADGGVAEDKVMRVQLEFLDVFQVHFSFYFISFYFILLCFGD